MTVETLPAVFFEIHSDLPREGPGCRESTEQAYSMLGLPGGNPRILDVGCGPGLQTMHLAALCSGTIVAVDLHQPFLDQLTRRAEEHGVADRVVPVRADMAKLSFAPGSFDAVWAEGSAYSIGFDTAISLWKPLLKPGGCLALTELVWTSSRKPPEAVEFWSEEYPGMRSREEVLEACSRAGYSIIGDFLIPDEAWWTDYYTPIERKLDSLRSAHASDGEALKVIELQQLEIDMRRRFPDVYGYLFIVLRAD